MKRFPQIDMIEQQLENERNPRKRKEMMDVLQETIEKLNRLK